jgi:hypothetical protein
MKTPLRTAIYPTWILVIPLLSFPQFSFAATEELNPAVSGNVKLQSGNFVLEENPFVLETHLLRSSNIDNSAFLEFSLDSLSSSVVITSVTLDLDVTEIPASGVDFPVVPVFGYAGNGVAELDDSNHSTTQLGVTDPITSIGFISIDLDAAFITGLLGNATHLGVLLRGDEYGFLASFDNIIDTPVLNVTFVGSPGDFDQDGDVDGRDFLIWQRGGSPTPLSPEDLMDWELNYGTEPPIVSVAVPEPTALGLALVALLGAWTRRSPAIC